MTLSLLAYTHATSYKYLSVVLQPCCSFFHREAHTAIKELNACPPYNLDVRFARSDEENERLQRKKREEQKVFEQLAAMQPQVTQDLPSIPGRAMQNSSLFRWITLRYTIAGSIIHCQNIFNSPLPHTSECLDGDRAEAGLLLMQEKIHHKWIALLGLKAPQTLSILALHTTQSPQNMNAQTDWCRIWLSLLDQIPCGEYLWVEDTFLSSKDFTWAASCELLKAPCVPFVFYFVFLKVLIWL